MWTITRATADSLRHIGGTIAELATFRFINISWDMNITMYKDVYSQLNRSKPAQKAHK